ncbi:DUF4476 domain-containing protein [Pedobacter sp. Hv1]|uniref:DUF4476 domain-containing protein n=1 Tax=Pedobacter sp. Hv1 TaxID=1740090 RepID=UPI0006D8C89B|nr:DUF4476 domain-containing protein [Pedobacter sp. Hv1]KQB99590.1 hypothetical protein AQF98_18735 [Pedobacter sp. Hv1]
MKPYILLMLALLGAQLSLAQNNRSKAEVFIQIEDQGNFTVYLDDEFVGSANGRFRFYDVYNTRPTLSILQGNKRIFSTKIDLQLDQRLILNYSLRRGLQFYKELSIYKDRQYALNDFDDYSNNFNTGIVPPTKPRPTENSKAFNDLSILIKKESFDDDKIKLIQAYVAYNDLSTIQVAILLKSIINDDKKLSLAKSLTPAISDIQNYYTLKESFTFISTKDNFINFLNSRPKPRAEQGSSLAADFEQLKSAVKREAFDDDKTKLIQAAFQNKSLSTGHMDVLLRLYTFEDKALICAKWAYRYVNDQQNYFTLKDVFKYKTNQDALLDFISKR